MGQRRLWPAVAAERVAVLGRDVRGQWGARRQVAAVLPLHGLHVAPPPGQEGVAEQLAQQQSILGQVVQQLGEVLRREKTTDSNHTSTEWLRVLPLSLPLFFPLLFLLHHLSLSLVLTLHSRS